MKGLRCARCGKEHPPEKVALSEGNPSKQPRPYHCRCCPETRGPTRGRATGERWPSLKPRAATAMGATPPHLAVAASRQIRGYYRSRRLRANSYGTSY
jgi:hypothetical protein